MVRTVLALVLALFLCLPANATIVISSLQPLQWVVETPLKVQKHNACSFSSINEEEGYWIGALHCLPQVNGFDYPMLIADEPATVYLMNEQWDALVLVSSAKAKAFKLAPKAPKKGDSAVIVGFPAGILTATYGIVLDRCKAEDAKWGHYTAEAYPGHSGSVVLNGAGVIGLANFTWLGNHPDVKKAKCGGNTGGTPWHVLKELVDMGVWKA